MTRRVRIFLVVTINSVILAALVALTLSQSQVTFAAPVDNQGHLQHVAPVKTVDPEAKGVNEGTKKQATGVQMRPVEKIDNEKIAGKFGEYGGCVPGYGRNKGGNPECLPPISPAAVGMGMTAQEHPWDCGEVRKLFPKGLKLDKMGTDSLKLDYNKDGVACGSGD